MAGTKRTMRRVPEDVAEAKYIHGLITADVETRIAQLAADGKHDEMQSILEWKRTWAGIVSDLTDEQKKEAFAAPLPIVHQAPPTDTSATGDVPKPEGGRTSRTERPKTA